MDLSSHIVKSIYIEGLSILGDGDSTGLLFILGRLRKQLLELEFFIFLGHLS